MWGADASERKKPTKQELAQKEMKFKAMKLAKERMNKYEIQLMSNGQCLDHLNTHKHKTNQKIEIVTDYLYYC